MIAHPADTVYDIKFLQKIVRYRQYFIKNC